jgi:CDP-diacylglycerol--glycerol-3-phosphate 3-phosphatidyltransferase
VKTVLQIAAVFALIALHPSPLWVDLLVYAAVAATVVSGADYFFGLRRHMSEDGRTARTGAEGV